MERDPHGQPYNLRFNRARRAERDLSEFLGLAKGLLADGAVSVEEAMMVRQWISKHADAVEQWPLNRLAARLTTIYDDGRVDDEERADLAELLQSIVGGTAGIVLGEDAATELPIDRPPPNFDWSGATVVFTGKFAYGTRAECQRTVTKLGASCANDVTLQTRYLVVGTFGSRDWVHTSFGRKIQKAVKYRDSGCAIAIAGEDHWVKSIDA
jgi:NAD-dependent DNA ligase